MYIPILCTNSINNFIYITFNSEIVNLMYSK